MKKTISITYKGIALAISILFGLEQIAMAAPRPSAINVVTMAGGQPSPNVDIIQNLSQINIPFEHCSLKEMHQGTNGKLIIHIQDAHANYSGQKNLARTLNKIMQAHDIQTVLLEGGDGDVSLDALRDITDKKTWGILANKFLLEGLITGAEYLNLTSNAPMTLMGIESANLYESNLRSYARLRDHRENSLKYIHKIQISVDRLKAKLYPKNVIQFEQNKKSAISPLDNFNELIALVNETSIDIAQEYPDIQELIQIKEKEKKINFKQINQEQAHLFDQLTQLGEGGFIKEIIQRSKVSQQSQVTQSILMNQLLNLAKQKGIHLNAYPNFNTYQAYLEQFAQLDLEKLMNQLEKLEDLIYRYLLPDDDIKRIRAIDRYLGLLKKAYTIQMSFNEFERFKFNEPIFETKQWQRLMNTKLDQLGYEENIIEYKPYLENANQDLKEFYALVSQRDSGFIDRANQNIKEDNNTAFMIAGGYHTQNLTQLMRKEGYSYLVLTPHIDHETNHTQYEKILLESLNILNAEERYLETSRVIDNEYKLNQAALASKLSSTRMTRIQKIAEPYQIANELNTRLSQLHQKSDNRVPASRMAVAAGGEDDGMRELAYHIARLDGDEEAQLSAVSAITNIYRGRRVFISFELNERIRRLISSTRNVDIRRQSLHLLIRYGLNDQEALNIVLSYMRDDGIEILELEALLRAIKTSALTDILDSFDHELYLLVKNYVGYKDRSVSIQALQIMTHLLSASSASSIKISFSTDELLSDAEFMQLLNDMLLEREQDYLWSSSISGLLLAIRSKPNVEVSLSGIDNLRTFITSYGNLVDMDRRDGVLLTDDDMQELNNLIKEGDVPYDYLKHYLDAGKQIIFLGNLYNISNIKSQTATLKKLALEGDITHIALPFHEAHRDKVQALINTEIDLESYDAAWLEIDIDPDDEADVLLFNAMRDFVRQLNPFIEFIFYGSDGSSFGELMLDQNIKPFRATMGKNPNAKIITIGAKLDVATQDLVSASTTNLSIPHALERIIGATKVVSIFNAALNDFTFDPASNLEAYFGKYPVERSAGFDIGGTPLEKLAFHEDYMQSTFGEHWDGFIIWSNNDQDESEEVVQPTLDSSTNPQDSPNLVLPDGSSESRMAGESRWRVDMHNPVSANIIPSVIEYIEKYVDYADAQKRDDGTYFVSDDRTGESVMYMLEAIDETPSEYQIVDDGEDFTKIALKMRVELLNKYINFGITPITAKAQVLPRPVLLWDAQGTHYETEVPVFVDLSDNAKEILAVYLHIKGDAFLKLELIQGDGADEVVIDARRESTSILNAQGQPFRRIKTRATIVHDIRSGTFEVKDGEPGSVRMANVVQGPDGAIDWAEFDEGESKMSEDVRVELDSYFEEYIAWEPESDSAEEWTNEAKLFIDEVWYLGHVFWMLRHASDPKLDLSADETKKLFQELYFAIDNYSTIIMDMHSDEMTLEIWWALYAHILIIEHELSSIDEPTPLVEEHLRLIESILKTNLYRHNAMVTDALIDIPDQTFYEFIQDHLLILVRLQPSLRSGVSRLLTDWNEMIELGEYETYDSGEYEESNPDFDEALQAMFGAVPEEAAETEELNNKLLEVRGLITPTNEQAEHVWDHSTEHIVQLAQDAQVVYLDTASETNVEYQTSTAELPHRWKFRLGLIEELAREGYQKIGFASTLWYIKPLLKAFTNKGDQPAVFDLEKILQNYLNNNNEIDIREYLALPSNKEEASEVTGALNYWKQLRDLKIKYGLDITLMGQLEREDPTKTNNGWEYVYQKLIDWNAQFLGAKRLVIGALVDKDNPDEEKSDVFGGFDDKSVVRIQQNNARGDYNNKNFSFEVAMNYAATQIGESRGWGDYESAAIAFNPTQPVYGYLAGLQSSDLSDEDGMMGAFWKKEVKSLQRRYLSRFKAVVFVSDNDDYENEEDLVEPSTYADDLNPENQSDFDDPRLIGVSDGSSNKSARMTNRRIDDLGILKRLGYVITGLSLSEIWTAEVDHGGLGSEFVVPDFGEGVDNVKLDINFVSADVRSLFESLGKDRRFGISNAAPKNLIVSEAFIKLIVEDSDLVGQVRDILKYLRDETDIPLVGIDVDVTSPLYAELRNRGFGEFLLSGLAGVRLDTYESLSQNTALASTGFHVAANIEELGANDLDARLHEITIAALKALSPELPAVFVRKGLSREYRDYWAQSRDGLIVKGRSDYLAIGYRFANRIIRPLQSVLSGAKLIEETIGVSA